MPEITVILPSLNVVRYIEACLQSVERQTFEDLEIICVDSGSTDGTLDIIKRHMELDKRIRLIISNKKSFGYQMNLGIEAAKGNYLAFVETDDYILPNMFERLYCLALDHDVDVVKADFDNVVELPEKQVWSLREGFSGDNERYYNTEISVEEHPELYVKEYLYWRGLYTKKFLIQNNIHFHESAGASNQDIGFFYQTYLYADKMYFANDSFYQYRRNRADASLFNAKGLEKLMGEYQYIETAIRRGTDRQDALDTYYYFRMFRQVYLRIRLAAVLEGNIDKTLRAMQYFRGVLNKALEDKKIDEVIFGNGNYTELMMFLTDPEIYLQYHKLNFKAQDRQISELINKMRKPRNIIIFGRSSLGGFCNCVLVSHGVLHVKAFCDNNKELQGTRYMGKAVLSPERAASEYNDAVYVLAGNRHNSDMRKQLLALGISTENITVYQLGMDWMYLNGKLGIGPQVEG